MATDAVRIPHAERFSTWFPDFLKKELAPYPGRGALVTRTVLAATISMILIVTFRIPGGVIGALSAFVLSRENLISTARSAIFMLASFVIGGLFIPMGARLMASTPETHFLWVGCSLFIVFFLLRTLVNYGMATGLALVVSNVIGIWYLPGPAERNVELTLWQVAATAIGVLVTLAVEVVFYAIHGRDDLMDGLDARLAQIEEQMTCYADGRPVSSETSSRLAQFAIVGSGALRRHVARGNYEPLHRMRMSTLVSLTGRSIDFAAALASGYPYALPELKERAAQLGRSIADIRHCLREHGRPCEVAVEPKPSPGTPLFSELESMVALMPSVFSEENATDPELEPVDEQPASSRIFIPDAFSNPEHLRYVLGGTLASMLCYIFYVSLAWPNLSTSVTTCVLTALTTIGSSRQKQILRVAGFVLGGIVFGIGAQIFVLPYIDSISGFTMLFAGATAVAAWIGTSSSRLSYAGVQFAFAFYLIHLSEFSMQTSLTVGRDRALGVLLGITMMWLVFERLSPRTAADEMVRIFIANLRQLAELVASSPCADDPASVLKIRREREEVYRRFGEVNAQSDAVPFETGAARAGDMAARDRIRRWQASLRTFYLLEAPLLQFRAFGDLRTKSRPFTEIEDRFRAECSQAFLQIADSLACQLEKRANASRQSSDLVALLDTLPQEQEVEFTERERALLRMTRSIAGLVDRLQHDVATEPLYSV
ncbi:MAG TPA: FUSC family protein [Terracidiphilus sp.]|jgi:multidrug resistance protein MdtO|nr:FUSC family protein [Terracidiphilus sp.]